MSKSAIGIGVVLLGILSWAYYEHETLVCVDYGVVKEITRAHHRSVDVLLEDGRVKVINQGHVAPGDKVCLELRMANFDE